MFSPKRKTQKSQRSTETGLRIDQPRLFFVSDGHKLLAKIQKTIDLVSYFLFRPEWLLVTTNDVVTGRSVNLFVKSLFFIFVITFYLYFTKASNSRFI